MPDASGRAAWLRRRQPRIALALVLARFCLALWQFGTSLPALAATLSAALLGGCLWWVAKRQIGPEAGLLALLLYLVSPCWHAGVDAAASLGLFALLFTAVGVAHALQGPRHKWGPRLGLLAAVTVGTACAAPAAAWLGLLLASAAMLYLGAGRRRLLVGVVAGATLLATGASLVRPIIMGWAPQLFVSAPPPAPRSFSGDLLAMVAALALWVASRRSRFFGNTAPLCAAVACMCFGQLEWALPLALLFVAAVFADGFDSDRQRLWRVLAFVVFAVQWLATYSLAGPGLYLAVL